MKKIKKNDSSLEKQNKGVLDFSKRKRNWLMVYDLIFEFEKKLRN